MSGARPAVNTDGTLAYNVALDVAGLKHYGGRANRDASGNYYIMAASSSSSSSGLLNTLGLGGLVPVVKGLPLVGNLLVGVPLLGDDLLWNGTCTQGTGYTWSNGDTWANGDPSADSAAVCRPGLILTALSLPFLQGGYELVVTPSIGIALFPDHGCDAQHLLKHADGA